MAANSVSIDIKGLDGLKGKLLGLIPKVANGVRVTVAETLLLMETEAKLLSPVDTGLNRAEIHIELANNGLSGQLAAGTTYAVDLEFGTRTMAARPFMHPAYEKYKPRFLTLLKVNTKLF